MKREIFEAGGERKLGEDEAEPVCGEDFCDTCGNCLACYGEEECRYGGQHLWIVYLPVDEWPAPCKKRKKDKKSF